MITKHKIKIGIGVVVGATALTLLLGGGEPSLTDKYNQATEIKAKYQLDGASLKRTIKDDPKDRIEVQVGNATDAEFSPSLKVARWDDEVNLIIKPKGLGGVAAKDKTLTFEGDKIKVSTPKVDYILYEMPASEANPEGAFEYQIDLKEKPLTNKIEFTLQDKDVDYFYQPALTQKEIDEGASRPENVVGSYAVYAKTPKTNWTGGKLYRTGKVGHIYRPKIIDSAGTEVWGDLHIENGILSVTIPSDFLDKAIYPVRHAAGLLFGYDTIAATTTNAVEDAIRGLTATGAAGTATTMSFYGWESSANGHKVKTALYDTSGNIITNATTTERQNITTTADWVNFTFATPPTITAINYWLAYWVNNGTGTLSYKSDNLNPDYPSIYKGVTYTTNWPNPLTETTNSNLRFSIYATYTAAAGAAAPVPIDDFIIIQPE